MSFRSLTTAVVSIALIAGLAGTAVAGVKKSAPRFDNKQGGNSNEIRLSASAGTVAYYANGKFKAKYRERITSAQVVQKFSFEVEAFTPNAEVPVILNGVQVATVIVNPTGGGEFQYTSFDNNPGGELPLPGGFPRLRAGDTITIGNLTSTFN